MTQRTVEFRRGSKVEPVQVVIPNTPEIQEQLKVVQSAQKGLQIAEQRFNRLIEEARASCQHDFEKIMRFDEDYCGRVDNRGRGQEVYIGKKCKKCGLFEPRASRPSLANLPQMRRCDAVARC